MRKKYPSVPEKLTLRLISYTHKGFRTIWLVTTLMDPGIYPREEIIKLYAYRWQIETRYNELKNVLQIENLRSRTAAGIAKEIWIHMTLVNLVRIIMQEAAGLEGVNACDLSFKHAFEYITQACILMLHSPIHLLPFICQKMIKEISKMIIIRRPGRRFSRMLRRSAHKIRNFKGVQYVEVS